MPIKEKQSDFSGDFVMLIIFFRLIKLLLTPLDFLKGLAQLHRNGRYPPFGTVYAACIWFGVLPIAGGFFLASLSEQSPIGAVLSAFLGYVVTGLLITINRHNRHFDDGQIVAFEDGMLVVQVKSELKVFRVRDVESFLKQNGHVKYKKPGRLDIIR